MFYLSGGPLALRPALGWVREGPQIYSAGLFPSCRLPYPDRLNGCTRLLLRRSHWPSSSLHRPGICVATIVGSQAISVTRLQSSLYGMVRPEELLALHRQGRFRSSLLLPSHLPEMSNITTLANQPIPATGPCTGKTSSIMGCEQSNAKNTTRKIKIQARPGRTFLCAVFLCVTLRLCGLARDLSLGLCERSLRLAYSHCPSWAAPTL
jgi:hypothetical protein